MLALVVSFGAPEMSRWMSLPFLQSLISRVVL